MGSGIMRARAVIGLPLALGLLVGSWTGAASAGEAEARGPLADRPSKPGAHLEKIKALGANSWLDLGKPAPDPKYGAAQGRSWSRKMAFAPDLRGAFLFGSGVHHGITVRDGARRFNDDLYFYDINAHAWVCCHPGTTVDAKGNLDSGVTLDKETGLNKDKDGRVIPVATSVHAYWTPEYDTDSKRFMFMPSTDPFGYVGNPAWSDPWSTDHAPYYYDARAGRFERRRAATPSPKPGVDTAVFYSARQKKAFYFNRGVWTYDLAANAWNRVNAEGGGNAAYCHDAKRDAVWVVQGPYKQDGQGNWVTAGPNVLSVYTFADNKWTKPECTGTSGEGAGSHLAFLTYDSANDAVVLHVANRHHVYDPSARRWTALPKTMPEQTAEWHRWANWYASSGFYDPETNAHFYFNAGDSNAEPGNMWVYRYAPAGGGDRKQ